MTRIQLRLVSLDEGGVTGSPESLRLVCQTDSGQKIAIWGRRSNTANIDSVLNAGLPCTIDCEYREPNDVHHRKYGHTYWVPETCPLIVLERRSVSKPEAV
jgi:hypothetical protein